MSPFTTIVLEHGWVRTQRRWYLYGQLVVGGLELIGGSFPTEDIARTYASIEFPGLTVVTHPNSRKEV